LARFHLYGSLHFDAPVEAERILDEILASKPRPADEVNAWYHKQCLAIYRKDYDEAERICRMLQKRMSDPKNRPGDLDLALKPA
jgi:hypothetical protein